MSGAIAVFVKTPGHSPVKTRLAAERGEGYAVEWYRRAASAVASVVRRVQAQHGVIVYWAVAEPAAFEAWTGWPTLAQGEGDLGVRMARVHARLVAQHGFGILLGADAPQLTASALGETIAWLSERDPRLVLGPAHDGGFWLFGGNVAPPLPRWTAVRYSAADTARELQGSMQELGEWLLLPGLTDVDHARDLGTVQDRLHALSDPTVEQTALARWMREQKTEPA